jgi:hypothetical protein
MFRAVRLIDNAGSAFHMKLGSQDATIRRQIMVLVCNISTYVILAAGLVQAVESAMPGTFSVPGHGGCDYGTISRLPLYDRPQECNLDIFTSLYFVLITVLTVGYGDIIPVTPTGRVVMLAVLLPMFILVPSEAGRLLSLLNNVSRFTSAYSGSSHGHVVLVRDPLSFGLPICALVCVVVNVFVSLIFRRQETCQGRSSTHS